MTYGHVGSRSHDDFPGFASLRAISYHSATMMQGGPDVKETGSERLNDWRGARVTVMGLGRFGGCLGAIRFLADRGARVTVTDVQPEDRLAESLAELDGLPLAGMHLGGHRDEDFTSTDFVVASPAVPRDNRYLAMARSAGVVISSEMNLFWQLQRGTVIAVTGSNGKSTTTALTHSILKATGRRIWLGGNIGCSLLPQVEDIQPGDLVVLELSSFQLEDLDRLRASPHGAVVTNFSPNHLDWHRTLDSYRKAKQTILRWQGTRDFCVLNGADPDVTQWPSQGHRLHFGLVDKGGQGAFLDGADAVFRNAGTEFRFPLRTWLRVPGLHNVQNALAASAAALAAGADPDAVRIGLQSYEPLPHRLQLVAESGGRRFYNDSLATTPESVVVALEAFDQPIVLLAGGYDKKIDLAPMAEVIARRARVVALMGQTAATLGDHITQYVQGTAAPLMKRCDDFKEAFCWSAENSRPGDVILLSPGCASYDWFRHFADRGDQFARLARECHF